MASGIGSLLISELQTLSTEARRKHPDIKEAAERVIVILRGIKSTYPVQISEALSKSDEVIRPFTLACKSNNHKLTTISLQCLQHLISHKALSPGSTREALKILSSVLTLGTDVQVKILQMILPLVTEYKSVSGEPLIETLHMCFVMHKSRDPIVNNTAAAILRQLVVAVFDRVVEEDKENGEDPSETLDLENRDTREEDLTKVYTKDAYFILQDLMLIVSDSDTVFIREEKVDKALAFELIESVLTNHSNVVARHTAMAQLLCERLVPFLVSFFAEKSKFPLAVRCMRIIGLFISRMHARFNTECEILLSTLVKLVDPSESKDERSDSTRLRRSSSASAGRASSILAQSGAISTFPPYYRMLAMEMIKHIFEDHTLLYELYSQYDGKVAVSKDAEPKQGPPKNEDCHIIFDLVAAVTRVVTERSEIRASDADGIPSATLDDQTPSNLAHNGNDRPSSDIGREANGERGQISAQSCLTRMELYKFLDKKDSPTVPENYLFYIAFVSLVQVVRSIAEQILPDVTTRITGKVNGKDITEEVLDISVVGSQDTKKLGALEEFVVNAWPELLSACSFIMGVRFDDELFGMSLDTVNQLVLVYGAIDGSRALEARDSFISMMCNACLPQLAITAHEKRTGGMRKSQSLSPVPEDGSIERSDNPTMLAKPHAILFSMNSRQIQCLCFVVKCTQYLAGVLGPAWYLVLVTLQQAEELLYQRRQAGSNNVSNAMQHRVQSTRRQSVSAGGGDEDYQRVQEEYSKLFALISEHSPTALMWALRALCLLSSDLTNVPVCSELSETSVRMMRGSIIQDASRITAAINDRPVFAMEIIRKIVIDNIGSAVGGNGGQDLWALVTAHLLDTTSAENTTLARVRTQACDAVSDMVLAAMEAVASVDGEGGDKHGLAPGDDDSGSVQARILNPLAQMMHGLLEVRKITLGTLNKLLQVSGHYIGGAWNVVFDIIQNVVNDDHATNAGPGKGNTDEDEKSPSLSTTGHQQQQHQQLIHTAFPNLQIICTDYLSDLPPNCLRRCVGALADYGSQREDLNISLTAIGQAWGICDFLHTQKKEKAADGNQQFASGKLLFSKEGSGAAAMTVESVVESWWIEDLDKIQSVESQQMLWLLLLSSLASLGRDPRHEVRHGAIQTLFRTIDMNADVFDKWAWDGVVWAILIPALDYLISERARVFGLVRSGKINEIHGAKESDEKARLATGSGIFVEDPGVLYRKQWDETATTAVMGVTKVWGENAAIGGVGYATQAWEIVWKLVGGLFTGRARDYPLIPQTNVAVTSTEVFVKSIEQDQRQSTAAEHRCLCTRGSVTSAIGAAQALAGASVIRDSEYARVAWLEWLSMGLYMVYAPNGMIRDFNAGTDGTSPVYTQEVASAYLQMFPEVFTNLCSTGQFEEAELRAVLDVARRVLLFADCPMYSTDATEVAPIQRQVLEIIDHLQTLLKTDSKRDGIVRAHAASSLVVGELAIYAAIAHVVTDSAKDNTKSNRLIGHEFISRVMDIVSGHIARVNTVLSTNDKSKKTYTRRAHRPTMAAFSHKAMEKLAASLVSENSIGVSVWTDAIVAVGVAMTDSDGSVDSGHRRSAAQVFVGIIPVALGRIQEDGSAALEAIWMVLCQTLGAPLDIRGQSKSMSAAVHSSDCSVQCVPEREAAESAQPVSAQIGVVKAVVEASLRFIGDNERKDAVEFWKTIVAVLGWGGQMANESTVMLSKSCVVAGEDAQALTVECFGWLFRMTSEGERGCPVWVSEMAGAALVRDCRAVVEGFVRDRGLLGRSPVTGARSRLLGFVLEEVERLECREGVFGRGGEAGHLMELYGSLVDLVGVPEAGVFVRVQGCLRRVGESVCRMAKRTEGTE